MFFETSFPIGSYDLDRFDHCRPSRLLGYLQEAAALAIDEVGASNAAMLRRYGCCWMVSRLKFTLDCPLRHRDTLTIKTWHRDGKAILYRDMDLSVNGVLAGQALAAWVLVDTAARSPRRLSDFPELRGSDGGDLCRQSVLTRLKPPDELTLAARHRVAYSDLDGNGHVNNTRYADFFCDAVGMERMAEGTFLRELQVDFLRECTPDQPLLLRAGEANGAPFVLGEDPSGVVHFLSRGFFG